MHSYQNARAHFIPPENKQETIKIYNGHLSLTRTMSIFLEAKKKGKEKRTLVIIEENEEK